MKKEKEIEAVLDDGDVDIDRLREFAISAGGLVTDKIRCRAWPKLIGIDVDNIPPKPSILLGSILKAKYVLLSFKIYTFAY